MKGRGLAKFIEFLKRSTTLFRRSFYGIRAMCYGRGVFTPNGRGVPKERDTSISYGRGVPMMQGKSTIVSTLGDN